MIEEKTQMFKIKTFKVKMSCNSIISMILFKVKF